MASTTEIVHAYRQMYRNLLRAVQYSIPNRFVARDQLRSAFREPGATFDKKSVKRTIWFLEAAAKEKGMEHRILRNLLMVQHVRGYHAHGWVHNVREEDTPMQEQTKTGYHHYDMTVAMLNKTMGLCLR
ncbi:hypothetical protein FZEAL_3425 [Fusarium zealandicum]|uniref:DUF1763-domain-containing protein n=1 Tax=Fusarium zealandicum TaxID=1053134 RepID=A0A8H4UPK4_9HYPO|nr:hypothetical protein FZEAL_3425 [Fusarium zealandicum]